jgi:hypothetical protein
MYARVIVYLVAILEYEAVMVQSRVDFQKKSAHKN